MMGGFAFRHLLSRWVILWHRFVIFLKPNTVCEKSPGGFSFVHAYSLPCVKTANCGALLLRVFLKIRTRVSAQRIIPTLLAPKAPPPPPPPPPNEYICDVKINLTLIARRELLRPFARQTLRNNTQQSVQTDATCNIQQCWELLATNVASLQRLSF